MESVVIPAVCWPSTLQDSGWQWPPLLVKYPEHHLPHVKGPQFSQKMKVHFIVSVQHF